MEKHRRATDGRRLFTAEFKREQLARVERQEVTLAELARDLSISPSVVGDTTRYVKSSFSCVTLPVPSRSGVSKRCSDVPSSKMMSGMPIVSPHLPNFVQLR